MIARIFPLFLLLAVAGCAASKSRAGTHLIDGAQLLSRVQTTAMLERLAEIERRSSVQLVVVTVPTLGDESIENYAKRTFAQIGVGQVGLNNGLLIVVVPNDGRMRIEVGTGLEWQIPDSVAASVVDMMVPMFGRGEYAGGISAAIDALAPLATRVDWSILHDDVSSVVSDGAAAVGRIASLDGLVVSLDESTAVLDVDGARVEARLPPHWSDAPFRLEVGSTTTLVARVRSVSPLVIEALGVVK